MSDKFSKKEAGYVPDAPGEERCRGCNMYANGICSLVRGPINPYGWCEYWDAKTSKVIPFARA